jgi:uncharacterized OB-fold protein
MSLEKCPKCGNLALEEIPTIGSKVLGKTKKCKKCGHVVTPKLPKNVGEIGKPKE